jgi:hypothetical protein
METLEKKPIQTPREVMKGMKVFITSMLTAGPILGVISAFAYRWIVVTYGQWDVSKDTFHMGLLFYGLGFTFPVLAISCRLMVKMFFQNCEQIENMTHMIGVFKEAHEKAPNLIKNIETVVDRAVPIASSIEEIIVRAKGMSEDVEKIAHRVRTAIDSMNGSFDLKVIEKKLETVADSLSSIAKVFNPIKKAGGDLPVPELPVFDPLKAGRK